MNWENMLQTKNIIDDGMEWKSCNPDAQATVNQKQQRLNQ